MAIFEKDFKELLKRLTSSGTEPTRLGPTTTLGSPTLPMSSSSEAEGGWEGGAAAWQITQGLLHLRVTSGTPDKKAMYKTSSSFFF